ncbi:BTB/POZ domain-containing protein [Ditylenchus destructor]|uniref:BTB/POZ domain-containing protein n=1 Tax=Ditylenchus destructor TaxID=166010 RepID=A0AAD4NAA4_9BILA|nr:BTB/POZ domain-containing protein [Ditylenchus destructor]
MSDSQYHNLMRNSSGESSSSALQNVPSNSTLYRVNIGGVGEIQHSSQILDQVATLLHNETCSDVTLIVDGCRLPAHRLILGMRSSYFWAMLYTGMLESTQSEITLVDTNVQPFKILLKYIYTGRMQLHSMNFELIIEVLALVHKYGFVELESEIAEYLKASAALRLCLGKLI